MPECLTATTSVPHCAQGFHKDGSVVLLNAKIARHYLRGWFAIDMISSVPLDTISLVSGVEIHQILRLNKVRPRSKRTPPHKL